MENIQIVRNETRKGISPRNSRLRRWANPRTDKRNELVEEEVDHGLRMFDTAPARQFYGR